MPRHSRSIGSRDSGALTSKSSRVVRSSNHVNFMVGCRSLEDLPVISHFNNDVDTLVTVVTPDPSR